MPNKQRGWGPVLESIPLCACGCGAPVAVDGRTPRKYRKGHHRRKHGFTPTGFSQSLAKKNYRLSKTYNVTVAGVEDLLKRQGGVCAICGTDTPGKDNTGAQQWSVDHCHATGRVRGILCRTCNAALGLFQENQETLHRALNYLADNGGLE